MVATIKQKVTVESDGSIVIRRTELPPGTQAEVIVIVSEASSRPVSQLQALRNLQKSMNLDRETAERWMANNRKPREWNRPRE